MTHTQFCSNGKEPNSVLQNSALKVVFSRVKFRAGLGERKKRREGNQRETTGLLLRGFACVAETDLGEGRAATADSCHEGLRHPKKGRNVENTLR